MTKGFIRIEIQDDELEKIMGELDKAQKTIYDCYTKLQDLGVLTVKSAADTNASGKGTD